jgi:hypothetical protein
VTQTGRTDSQKGRQMILKIAIPVESRDMCLKGSGPDINKPFKENEVVTNENNQRLKEQAFDWRWMFVDDILTISYEKMLRHHIWGATEEEEVHWTQFSEYEYDEDGMRTNVFRENHDQDRFILVYVEYKDKSPDDRIKFFAIQSFAYLLNDEGKTIERINS